MALDAAHRASIFEKLRPILGDEDANVLMSEFPSVEAQELVTKDFLRAELALLRGEMTDMRAELRGEMTEMRADTTDARAELRAGLAEVRADLAGARTEIADLQTTLTVRVGAAIAAGVTVLTAVSLLA